MSNISKAVEIFQTMRQAHINDIKNAQDGVKEMTAAADDKDGKQLAIDKEKQLAQIDMMDFQGMMQLEQQLISTMSQVTATEGRTNDAIIKNIG
jgi:hypothetical protein